jgi:hypothetical protein
MGDAVLLTVGDRPLDYRAAIVWKWSRNDSSGSRAMKPIRSLSSVAEH